MQCTNSKCGYSWESKIEDPKACPKCKRYLETNRVEADVKNKFLFVKVKPDFTYDMDLSSHRLGFWLNHIRDKNWATPDLIQEIREVYGQHFGG